MRDPANQRVRMEKNLRLKFSTEDVSLDITRLIGREEKEGTEATIKEQQDHFLPHPCSPCVLSSTNWPGIKETQSELQ